MKKILWMLSLLFLILTIGSCRSFCEKNYPSETYEYTGEEFDDIPKRVSYGEPETVEDLANIIIHYEELVSEWESWGISVYETLDIPLPDSLQSIKNYLELQNEQSPIID